MLAMHQFIAPVALAFALMCGGALAQKPPAVAGDTAYLAGLERITQELVKPPLFPQHSQQSTWKSGVVVVRLVIEEKEIEVEPSVFIWAFTFNGGALGPNFVVLEGDYVELTLANPKANSPPHNIDFHAAAGAMGGAR